MSGTGGATCVSFDGTRQPSGGITSNRERATLGGYYADHTCGLVWVDPVERVRSRYRGRLSLYIVSPSGVRVMYDGTEGDA